MTCLYILFFLIFLYWQFADGCLVSVMVVGGGSGRDEVVVELWRKRK